MDLVREVICDFFSQINFFYVKLQRDRMKKNVKFIWIYEIFQSGGGVDLIDTGYFEN